jgi:hypothetical protein
LYRIEVVVEGATGSELLTAMADAFRRRAAEGRQTKVGGMTAQHLSDLHLYDRCFDRASLTCA